MFCLVNGLGLGSVAGWCWKRGGFTWPVPRTSALAVCSDICGLWPGADGAIVTSSSSGRPVQQDVGGQLPGDGESRLV